MNADRDTTVIESVKVYSNSREGSDFSMAVERATAIESGEPSGYMLYIAGRNLPGPSTAGRAENTSEGWFEVDATDFQALYDLLGTAIASARARGILPGLAP